MKKSIITIAVSVAVSVSASYGVFTKLYQPVDDVKSFLISNPEFLIDVSNALNDKQENMKQKQISENVLNYSSELLDEKNIIVGDLNAPITVIEFFDYQCPFCQAYAPALKNLMDNNKNVRVVFMETPVLSRSFPISALAAKFGISLYNQYGSEKYKEFHDSLFSKKIPEGKLTVDDLTDTIKSIGVDAKTLDINSAKYTKNIELFQNLGLNGTPATIVMPTKGANEKNIRIVAGNRPNVLFDSVKRLGE